MVGAISTNPYKTTGERAGRAQQLFGLLDDRKMLLGQLEQPFPHRRQRHASGGPVEQADIKL